MSRPGRGAQERVSSAEAEVGTGAPDDVPVINLGAWNDDPTVIQAIKVRIDALMDN